VRRIVAGYVETGNPFDRLGGTQAAGALTRTQGVDAREVNTLHARGLEMRHRCGLSSVRSHQPNVAESIAERHYNVTRRHRVGISRPRMFILPATVILRKVASDLR
jgi:hypothetical protein